MADKCKHDACACKEARPDGYCSDNCKEGKLISGVCDCGHPDCGMV